MKVTTSILAGNVEGPGEHSTEFCFELRPLFPAVLDYVVGEVEQRQLTAWIS